MSQNSSPSQPSALFSWVKRVLRRGPAFLQKRNARALLWYWALLALPVAWLTLRAFKAAWKFTIDDSGISYAFAKHLAQGLGPVAVVGGPWVEGYSNPLWVFVLVPFHWLGLPIPEVAKGLGVALFALAVALGIGLLRDRQRASLGAVPALLALAMGCSLEVIVWSVSGLENALLVALMLAVAYLDVRERRDATRFAFSGLVAFGLAITRPEGAMYVAPLLALKAWDALRDVGRRRQALTAFGLFLVPFALYHVIHYLVFHEFVANTYYAKPRSRALAKGYQYLRDNLKSSGLTYLLGLAALSLLSKSRAVIHLLWHAFAGAFFILYSGGDWMPHGRFVAFVTPSLLVLVAMGLDQLISLLRKQVRVGPVWVREGMAFSAALGLAVYWNGVQAPRTALLAKAGACHFCERQADARALMQLSERAGFARSSVVTQDFGGPAWLSQADFVPIDFLGLCDVTVARLRREKSGKVANNFPLYQYLFHEQAEPPTWVYLPPNFWRQFRSSTEYALDYYVLEPRLLPKARSDAYLALHRSQLIDFFPPVATRQPLTLGGLRVMGSAVFSEGAAATAVAGRLVRVVVSAVPTRSVGESDRVALQVSGQSVVTTKPVALARGISGLARKLSQAEPLSLEFNLKLPKAGPNGYAVSLGFSQGSRTFEPQWGELASIAVESELSVYRRQLPRVPVALPEPRHAELLALRERVMTAVAARWHFAGTATQPTTSEESDLGRKLVDLGRHFAAEGLTSQAYLAYIWATQLVPRSWEELALGLLELRRVAVDDHHAFERSLLRAYYAAPSETTLSYLVGYYLASARHQEAQYFLARLDNSEPAAALEPWASLKRVAAMPPAEASNAAPSEALSLVATDPFHDGDFETHDLTGWLGDSATFSAGPLKRAQQKVLRGHHGGGVLSSGKASGKATGTLTSPKFTLNGNALTLLVGGGSAANGQAVDLLVDGAIVETAAGNNSKFLFPVIWDVSKYRGKSAQVRLTDKSSRQLIMIDRVLLWQ